MAMAFIIDYQSMTTTKLTATPPSIQLTSIKYGPRMTAFPFFPCTLSFEKNREKSRKTDKSKTAGRCPKRRHAYSALAPPPQLQFP
jgi:hypothetical protein